VNGGPTSRDPEGSQSRLLDGATADPTVGRLRRTLPDAWRIIRPYWVSDDRWAGLGLLLAVVGLTLAMVYLSVLLNRWNNDFFSELED
jgi:putative ATP-binding cassette transporter